MIITAGDRRESDVLADSLCPYLYVENSTDSVESLVIPIVPDLSRFLEVHSVDTNNNADGWCFTVGDGITVLQDGVNVNSIGDQNETTCCDTDIDEDTNDPNDDEDPDYVADENAQLSSDSETADDVSQSEQACQTHTITAGSAVSIIQHGLGGNTDSQVNSEVDASHNIVVMMTSNSVHRQYDKVSFCYFCHKPQSKLCRHLTRKHKNESEVEEYCMEADKTKKNIKMLKLRNLGNHVHNQRVVTEGKGDFVVIHRPNDEADFRKYVACRYCYGYLSKQAIWKHDCPLAPKKEDGTKIPRLKKASDKLAGDASTNDSAASFCGLLSGMRQDEVGQVASKDALILSLGRKMCTKFGNDSEQFNYIRSKMRLVAKLLMTLRKSTGESGSSMSEFIVPTKFKAVLSATKMCAGLNDTGTEYGAPSSAMKSGGVIRRLAEIKESDALQRGDTATAELCSQFLKVCDVNWSSEISSVAIRNLSQRKRKGVFYLPLTEDVVQLNNFLVAEANKLCDIVEGSADAYFDLTQVVLAKLLLFNRKRQGEVSKIKLEDYQKKGKSDNTVAALALNEFEQALLRTLERIKIKGKKDRTVAVLLTEEVVTWIDKLLLARHAFVPTDNSYLFATASERSYFRGSDVMRKFAVQCNAERPASLTSTNLRKSVACMAQVLSLKEHEMESLATFMGHDIRVHTQFYRLPLDVIQVARVAKIFLAAEQGRISEYAGKQLSDISIDDKEEVEEVEACSGEDSDMSDNDEAPAEPIPAIPTSSEQDCSAKKRRRMSTRKQWSEAEKQAVRSYFSSFIIERKLPGKHSIEKFLKEKNIDRKWTSVKDHIRNQYLE